MTSHSAPQLRDQWALKGAMARLKEIDEERAGILAVFPELQHSARSAAKTAPAAAAKTQRKMSPEARKRMSEGMRKFWARRKASAKSKTKGAST